MVRYQALRAPDTELRGRLRELANERRRFGYRRLFVLLRREGEPSGINRIYRLYREEGLTVRKRKARRKAIGTRAPILVAARPNARPLSSFAVQTTAGLRGRWISLCRPSVRPRPVRQRPALPSAQRGRRCYPGVPRRHPEHFDFGAPGGARTDGSDRAPRQAGNDRQRSSHWNAIGPRGNGEGHGTDLECHPAVVFRAPDRMALHRAGQADARHGFVESFNGRMRDELLNETMFRNLAHARVVIAAWAADYNTERPHSALDYQTPADYARALTTAIARLGSREMITPRVGRLLNLRRSA